MINIVGTHGYIITDARLAMFYFYAFSARVILRKGNICGRRRLDKDGLQMHGYEKPLVGGNMKMEMLRPQIAGKAFTKRVKNLRTQNIFT